MDAAAWDAHESARKKKAAEEAAERQAERERLLKQPTAQIAFLKVVENARIEFAAADTDFKRGATRPARAKAVCSTLNSRTIGGWVGRVATLSTNGDGLGVLSVEIADYIYLSTWNNSFSDFADNTLIPANSPLYQTMSSLKIGDHVRFDGRLFRSDTNVSRIELPRD
ncbi:hypothetical protein SAMN04488061_0553 [Filomicrobium insigne]|uniref:DUF5666 domain-containing protein n=1 Tax=Filomicrobium insigne TaxID=418854 RepID=A0A1H0HN25_9HYPH|nr:hypothetical protein SAMN04488061_0553 [Filomicrobium insigne]